ncbi:MAG: phage fiber-tail adaptor protein [Blastomonas fulva]|uniref:phage fiber-tail adaptor protein n=1 Tax=Blastomonas fulva TaxID=1550728 RepID=UPI004033A77C
MSYSHKFPNKDPQAFLDYELDLVDKGCLAEGETVTDQAVTCPDTDITISQITQIGGVIRFWVAGGEAGTDYFATVQFTTSAGRIDQRTALIPVRER